MDNLDVDNRLTEETGLTLMQEGLIEDYCGSVLSLDLYWDWDPILRPNSVGWTCVASF